MSGAGGDYHTTYFPQATFISSRKYLFHYDGYNYAEFDFSHNQYHEVFIKGDFSNLAIIPRNNMADLVKSFVTDTPLGKMAPLPSWLRDGIILGVQGGTDIVNIFFKYLSKIISTMSMYRTYRQNQSLMA